MIMSYIQPWLILWWRLGASVLVQIKQVRQVTPGAHP
jgi:hypothetical protein